MFQGGGSGRPARLTGHLLCVVSAGVCGISRFLSLCPDMYNAAQRTDALTVLPACIKLETFESTTWHSQVQTQHRGPGQHSGTGRAGLSDLCPRKELWNQKADYFR